MLLALNKNLNLFWKSLFANTSIFLKGQILLRIKYVYSLFKIYSKVPCKISYKSFKINRTMKLPVAFHVFTSIFCLIIYSECFHNNFLSSADAAFITVSFSLLSKYPFPVFQNNHQKIAFWCWYQRERYGTGKFLKLVQLILSCIIFTS